MATSATENEKLKCGVCNAYISETQYRTHVLQCEKSDENEVQVSHQSNTKDCPICLESISANDYREHVYQCTDELSPRLTTRTNTKECIICFKAIPQAHYREHVYICLENSSLRVNTKAPTRSITKTCLICSSPVEQSKTSSHTIPCRAQHTYCLKCLQRSMNEFIQFNTPPTCHSTLCDYQLSRYDIECLPLQTDIIQQLLPLVKTTQRPQCPFCLFYVEFNTMNDLQKHTTSCDVGNMIPCEYCHCLYDKRQVREHAQQCHNTSSSERQKALIDFIMPRIKYPVTTQQLHFFLQHRKNNRLPIDPHAIIDALAKFDGAFPFEVPTRDCDICAESYLYDDIFVIGCNESHKLCYGCFADSCTAKMNNNEILTCPMCIYQLPDGELKYLRIPADQKRKFLNYQTQKTFNVYTSNAQGVIKCPNKQCKWVAEAQNPNERFLVQCRLCQYEFCSLCNQHYHYRTTCQQIPELTQRWFFWCNTERGNYWRGRAQEDATFRAQFEDYERQRTANRQRNEELRQRYNELLADEQYKAQNCRLCPNCGRVVQHLGGCDLMVCGRNYHGGDDQSGCGHDFNFSEAPPYIPLANTGPRQVRNNVLAPKQQKLVVHRGVQCDACHNEVQGIRFDCIHCFSLTFCEKCEQRATLKHSNEIRAQNKQQHVFQLIINPLNTKKRR